MFFAGRRVTGKVGESRGRWAARCGSCRPPGHGQGASGALACWRIPCRPYLGRWQVWWPSPARESWSSRAPCFLTVSFKPENPEAAVKSEAQGPWGSVSCGAAGRGGTPQSPVSPRRQHGRAGLECARSPRPSRGVNVPQPPGGPASTQLNAHRCRPLPSTRNPPRPSQQVPPRRAVFSLCLFGVVSSSVCSLPTPGPGCDLGRGVPARRAVTLHSVRPCVALTEQEEPGLCGSRTAPVTSARLPKPAPPAPRAPRSPARAGSTPGSRHAGGGLGGQHHRSRGVGGSRFSAAPHALVAERYNPPGNVTVHCNTTHCCIRWQKPRARSRLSDLELQYQLQVQWQVRMRTAPCGAPRPRIQGPGYGTGLRGHTAGLRSGRTPARRQQTHSRRAQRPVRGRGARAARRPRATVCSEPGPPGPAPSSVCGGRTASSCPPGHQGAAVTCAGSRSRSDQGAEPPPRAVTPGSRGSPGRPPALAHAGSGPLRALKRDSGRNPGKAFKTGTSGRFPFYCFPRTT